MHNLDWFILISTILFIVIYGAIKTRKNSNINSFLKGDNSSNWFTIGVSVMATQASAITFLSTPGQAYNDGMGFLQFYLGLPLAMIIICIVFVPIYHKLKVFTAYEFLEKRFDKKTRTLGAILFLVQRGLAAGITIFAPSIILSSVLNIDLKLLNIIIGLLVIIYTVSGGTKGVNITQKQQMFVIFFGLFFVFFFIINNLPEQLTTSKLFDYAKVSDKMKILDFSFEPNNRYTFWSGITGGLFLALSYFGTDQSQVQRYISGKSVREIRLGLVFNGIFKIPMQFFILLIGVLVFIFFEFNNSPLNFNPQAVDYLEKNHKLDFESLKEDYKTLNLEKEEIQRLFLDEKLNDPLILNSLQQKEMKIRDDVKDLIDENSKIEKNDKDYVFLHFILNYLPRGLIGLLIAVIICAAMSSTASELNALAATTTVDLYRRNLNVKKSEKHFLKMSKFFTITWGLIAICFASIGNLFENLIQLVNIIGSIFYGTILGMFLVAFFIKKITANSVFWAACISQTIIFSIYFNIDISYLWLNFIGAVVTILLSIIFESLKLFSR
ncbi:MAG: sodium:solute symporter [Flavobacteriaceae bacterium]|nr:sodium:solute symporter [Flavobacteriaceae bacterium]